MWSSVQAEADSSFDSSGLCIAGRFDVADLLAEILDFGLQRRNSRREAPSAVVGRLSFRLGGINFCLQAKDLYNNLTFQSGRVNWDSSGQRLEPGANSLVAIPNGGEEGEFEEEAQSEKHSSRDSGEECWVESDGVLRVRGDFRGVGCCVGEESGIRHLNCFQDEALHGGARD